MIEIVCGPVTGSVILEEIPFVCSLFSMTAGSQISVMYEVGCNTENDRLWLPFKIETVRLPAWIERSIQDTVFVLAKSDIFIFVRTD